MAKERNYKSTEKFEQCIKEYLDSVASTSPEFAEKYNDPEKSVEECCDYICSEVKRQKKSAYTDGEIYYMARHYYNEPKESLQIDTNRSSCKVISPTDDELPNELEDEVIEEKPKTIPAAKKPKPNKEKTNPYQISMFDILGDE